MRSVLALGLALSPGCYAGFELGAAAPTRAELPVHLALQAGAGLIRNVTRELRVGAGGEVLGLVAMADQVAPEDETSAAILGGGVRAEWRPLHLDGERANDEL